MKRDTRLALQLKQAGFPHSESHPPTVPVNGRSDGLSTPQTSESDTSPPSLEQLISESENRLQSLEYRKEFGEWVAYDDNGTEYANGTSLWDTVARFWLNTHRALDLNANQPSL